ncbi:MAG: ABC transporter substrate-binding protein [Thermoleophilia bacterium]|nr:ABC transporter substrate-binding protein [Thermoleophilia bacterium]
MKLDKRIWLLLMIAVLMAGMVFAVAACGGDEEEPVTTETTAAPPVDQPASGGTFAFYINEPAFIDPVNLQESEGTQVGNAVFDSLAKFNYNTGALEPAAAKSWEPNADATVWTFHLVEGAKFHDGTPVTAADFKYAWERICNPANESEISYHLSAVKGYDAMQEGTATELEGVKAIDANTLEVTLSYAFGDFEYVVGHPALAPVPKAVVEADPAAFGDKPIGNGPFMMAEPWSHDQYIKVVRFADYYGDKAYLDGVDFKIFKDEDTAWLEFQAGNLDFTSIPSGQLASTSATYGVSDDGVTVAKGKQTLTGPETAIYYLLVLNTEETMKNPLVRQALSLAINRQTIADTVYEGIRQPATNIVPEGVAGYEDGAWQYSKYDVEAAKAKLAEAGYPNGEGLPDIVISFNSGSGHEDVMTLVQADFAAIGVTATLDGVEWAQYLDKLSVPDYMIGRLGWIADSPIIDNFLYPLFTTGSADNYAFYSDPAVDTALADARQTTDTNERIAKYQAIVKTIGDEAPVIPIVKYRHHHVGSDRINDLVYSAQGLASLEKTWISAAQ